MEIQCTYDDINFPSLYIANFTNLHINQDQFREDFQSIHLLEDLNDENITGLLFQNCMIQSLSPGLALKFTKVTHIVFKNSSLENVEWKNFEMFQNLKEIKVEGCLVELFMGTIFEKCGKLKFVVDDRSEDDVKLEGEMVVKVERKDSKEEFQVVEPAELPKIPQLNQVQINPVNQLLNKLHNEIIQRSQNQSSSADLNKKASEVSQSCSANQNHQNVQANDPYVSTPADRNHQRMQPNSIDSILQMLQSISSEVRDKMTENLNYKPNEDFCTKIWSQISQIEAKVEQLNSKKKDVSTSDGYQALFDRLRAETEARLRYESATRENDLHVNSMLSTEGLKNDAEKRNLGAIKKVSIAALQNQQSSSKINKEVTLSLASPPNNNEGTSKGTNQPFCFDSTQQLSFNLPWSSYPPKFGADLSTGQEVSSSTQPLVGTKRQNDENPQFLFNNFQNLTKNSQFLIENPQNSSGSQQNLLKNFQNPFKIQQNASKTDKNSSITLQNLPNLSKSLSNAPQNPSKSIEDPSKTIKNPTILPSTSSNPPSPSSSTQESEAKRKNPPRSVEVNSQWRERCRKLESHIITLTNHIQNDQIVIAKLKTDNQMLEDLKKIFADDDFKDFNFIIKEFEFPVHKLLFAARSSIFANLIRNNPQAENMKLVDVPVETFQNILDFIYGNDLRVFDENLIEVFAAAGRLNIVELMNWTAMRILEKIDENNALQVITLAHKYQNEKLRMKAFEVIKEKIFTDRKLDEEFARKPEKIKKLIEMKKKYDEEYERMMKGFEELDVDEKIENTDHWRDEGENERKNYENHGKVGKNASKYGKNYENKEKAAKNEEKIGESSSKGVKIVTKSIENESDDKNYENQEKIVQSAEKIDKNDAIEDKIGTNPDEYQLPSIFGGNLSTEVIKIDSNIQSCASTSQSASLRQDSAPYCPETASAILDSTSNHSSTSKVHKKDQLATEFVMIDSPNTEKSLNGEKNAENASSEDKQRNEPESSEEESEEILCDTCGQPNTIFWGSTCEYCDDDD